MADGAPTKSGPTQGAASRYGLKTKARRPGPVTALDIDDQMVRIVQATPRANGTAVTRIEAVPLQFAADANRAQPEILGQAVAACLDKVRLKPGAVVLGIPRHSVILRTVAVPPIENVRELASVVHLQIGRELPFRADDAVIDFTVSESPGGRLADSAAPPAAAPSGAAAGGAAVSKIEVLVAAVRKETVDFYQKVAAAAGLKLIALGWLSQANARCLEACQVGQDKESVALISLRPNEVGIDIAARCSLRFSRGAALNLNAALSPAEEATEPANPPKQEPPAEQGTAVPGRSFVEAVLIEVVRSLHSYGSTEPQTPVTKLVVAGATGQERMVAQALQARLNIPTSLLDVNGALEIPKEAQDQASGCIGALGLALGVNDAAGLPFDFLSPKRPAVQRNMQRIRMLALSAAGTALLIGLLGIRSHLVNQRMKIQRQLQLDVTAAEKNRTKYKQMQVQAATVQNWTRDSRNWLEQYAFLSAILPPSEELYVTSISMGGQGSIHLAVQARSGEILASLDKRLRAAGYEVKPLAITPGNDRYGYGFRSTVELLLSAKMKVDLSKVQPPARPPDDGSLDQKKSRKGGRS